MLAASICCRRAPTRSFRWPDFLPDGETVLFAASGNGPPRIQAVSLRSRRVTDLGITGTQARYVGRGHLVYATAEGELSAVPFDPAGPRVLGPEIAVAANVRVTAGGAAKLAHSRNGILAWLGGSAARRDLVLVDAAGRVEGTRTPPDLYESPRFSPDGQRIAVGIGDLLGGRPDIWVLDLASGNALTRITADDALEEFEPIVAPRKNVGMYCCGRSC